MTLALAELPAASRATLAAAETRRSYAPGGTIVAEDGTPDELFRIESGTVAVVRNGDDGTEHTLAELGPGEIVGEMAFLDGEPRSASVRALSEVTLSRLSAAELAATDAGSRALSDLRAALGAAIVTRMRDHNDRYLESLEREVSNLKEREQFGVFYIYSIVTMGLGTIANVVIARNIFDVDVYSVRFGWQYLAIYLLPLFVVLIRMKLPVSELGLTTRGLGRSLTEGIAISAVLIGVMAVASFVLGRFDIMLGTPTPMPLTVFLSYALHSFLQELLARGFLQSAYQRFLNDARGIKSVILSSVLFGMFHLHFGLHAVLITTVGGFLFGCIFLRHKNLAGVTLVHVALGTGAFVFGFL
ncbi:cyclic nucleotide-binding domain-containing protein [Acuticoccus sp. MNP-M23]|uniref:cyclic nucleotide-binding domain-containing protein n=1 Tax=Acuticoccus sp. MNP-M23 TaxID=3072793 RepID=UPI0028169C60|nr:cyclic nucleotide-binding domain-containing protein [Acuticoccus sp. MNP-M23]WMS41080.1 cyclic nucleotide-binding domain-containing protein [Acuticoccus sp. MNP-M23]